MNNQQNIELSIVMPCLNESITLEVCIKKALEFIKKNDIIAEIIIADNGSTDGSDDIAITLGVRLVRVSTRGYGAAIIGGIKASRGKYIIIGDSDNTYDFTTLLPFLQKFREGYDFVIGNRKNGILPGAMSFSHKYIGNPILSFIGKLFFASKINDFHCGLRGISRNAFKIMNLRTSGMEFASEMVVKATILKLKTAEIPINLYPSPKERQSHLRTFRDGWRHLRFLFLYSPRWLFFYPGIALIIFGVILNFIILPSENIINHFHTMIYSVALIMIGFQAVIFAIFSKTFAVQEKLLPINPIISKYLSKNSLEVGLITASIMLFLGFIGLVYSYIIGANTIFYGDEMNINIRIVVSSFTLIVTSFQLIFSSFFFSLLKLELLDKSV